MGKDGKSSNSHRREQPTMADRLLGRKVNTVRDQLRAAEAEPVDADDPIFDSETEDDRCFYVVLDVAADEIRQGMHRVATYHNNAEVVPGQPPMSAEAFIVQAEKVVSEFYETMEIAEVGDRLKELGCFVHHDAFVVVAVRTSLDKTEEVQRRISALLTVLCDRKILSKSHVTRGFEKLIQAADDITLDVPHAAEKMLAFVACAVEDGCVDAVFVRRFPESFLKLLQKEALEREPALLRNLSELRDFKEAVRKHLPDFFNSGSPEEAKLFLEALPTAEFRHEYVRLSLMASLEKSDSCREMVSNALDCLYGVLLKADDVQLGFGRVIGSSEDLALDSPNAHELIAKFVARGVVDEILPPSFLPDNHRLHVGGSTGMAILRRVQKWLSDQKGRAVVSRFRKIWTGTDPNTRDAKEFKHEIKDCILEYLDSRDTQEGLRLIADMELSPDQCAETVRKIIVLSMERSGKTEDLSEAAIVLLKCLADKMEFFDEEVLQRGFEQTHQLLRDISLDVPKARWHLDHYIEAAKKKELLPATFEVPT